MSFSCREDFLSHVDAEHGGLQRYRNAFFSLAALLPHVVRGQEWRAILGNFSEFISRASKDWENFTPDMKEAYSAANDGSHDIAQPVSFALAYIGPKT